MENKDLIKVGDIISVIIESKGEKGSGVAKINGYVIFINNTEINKKYKICITRILDKYGFGEIVGGKNGM